MLKVFTYCNAKGHLGAYELANFSESAEHYQGFLTDGGGIRTFRKDRVIEYHESLDQAEAAIPADYVPPEIPAPKPRSKDPTICFTGFKKDIKAQLNQRAEAANLGVRTGVSGSLSYLCCGPNAGPVKIEKSRKNGVTILSESQFLNMLDTGEIPEFDETFHYTFEATQDKNAETEEAKAVTEKVANEIQESFVGLRAVPRREVLIAQFEGGFAAGWKFAVPESFKSMLDIKWTPTVVHGHQFHGWTQGHAFEFSRGTMIHSNRSGYVHGVTLQVFSTAPAGFETKNALIGDFTGSYINQNVSITELEQHRLEVSRQMYDPGTVVFDIYGSGSGPERVTLSQVEFVALLQHGFYWQKPTSKDERPNKVVLVK